MPTADAILWLVTNQYMIYVRNFETVFGVLLSSQAAEVSIPSPFYIAYPSQFPALLTMYTLLRQLLWYPRWIPSVRLVCIVKYAYSLHLELCVYLGMHRTGPLLT